MDSYINSFENITSEILFIAFKVILIILVVLLIFSLILLAIGCLIKSQKLRTKFLTTTISLLIGNIFFLFLPYLFVYLKNII